jgi:hypothetical protein
LTWKGISSLRGFVAGGKKGGKEKHRRAALVRTVLFACNRRQASNEAVAAFDDATAAQRLDTLQAWLEEGWVNATTAVLSRVRPRYRHLLQTQ